MILQGRLARLSNRRRGVVAVQVTVILVLILGFAAFTVDIGALYNARADLQKAADAAALAGVSILTSDEMMRVRAGTGDTGSMGSLLTIAKSRVDTVSPLNPSYGSPGMYIEPADMVPGWIDMTSNSSAIQTGGLEENYTAISVTARRTAEASNGAVQFLFAPVLGSTFGETTATATAVFDDRFGGVRVTQTGAGLLPFTIHKDAFASELTQGGDQYSYNEGANAVDGTSDGIREIRLYPYPLSGSGYSEGDGNFGVLNIGTGNQGVDAEVVQIQNGVSAGDMESEVGTSILTFHDDAGYASTYDITGSPGLEATLKSALSDKVGEVVGFFLHDNVVLSGANATYRVTGLRYGRVMAIKLTGPPNKRGFFIQPTSYVGSEITVHEDAPSSGGLLGRIVIAR